MSQTKSIFLFNKAKRSLQLFLCAVVLQLLWFPRLKKNTYDNWEHNFEEGLRLINDKQRDQGEVFLLKANEIATEIFKNNEVELEVTTKIWRFIIILRVEGSSP